MKALALLSATTIGSLLPLVNAYGINCQGPSMCHFRHRLQGAQGGLAESVDNYLMGIPDDVYIEPNDLIACHRDLCAWVSTPPRCSGEHDYDGEAGWYGDTLKSASYSLVKEHKCVSCGEVARYWPEGKHSKKIWCGGRLEFGIRMDKSDFGCDMSGICPKYMREIYGDYWEWKEDDWSTRS